MKCAEELNSTTKRLANPDGKSNFNLQNVSSDGHNVTGFTANFTVAGQARNLSSGALYGFTGTFSATVDGESYQTVLGQILTGHPQDFTYVASFSMAPVPEPGYVLVLAGAMLIIATKSRRSKNAIQ